MISSITNPFHEINPYSDMLHSFDINPKCNDYFCYKNRFIPWQRHFQETGFTTLVVQMSSLVPSVYGLYYVPAQIHTKCILFEKKWIEQKGLQLLQTCNVRLLGYTVNRNTSCFSVDLTTTEILRITNNHYYLNPSHRFLKTPVASYVFYLLSSSIILSSFWPIYLQDSAQVNLHWYHCVPIKGPQCVQGKTNLGQATLLLHRRWAIWEEKMLSGAQQSKTSKTSLIFTVEWFEVLIIWIRWVKWPFRSRFLQINGYYKEANAHCVHIYGYLESIKSIYGTIEFIERGW